MEEEKTGRREKQWSVVSDLWPEKAKLGFAVLNPTYGLNRDREKISIARAIHLLDSLLRLG